MLHLISEIDITCMQIKLIHTAFHVPLISTADAKTNLLYISVDALK